MAQAPLVQNFPLPGEILNTFAVDWSADNRIAVCTSKTIFIMNSRCSALEIGFPFPLHKQAICANEKPLKLCPVKIPSNPYNFAETPEDNMNLQNALNDHTLNPAPSERAEMFRSFRSCKWSPKGAASNNRCLLASLTYDHRLQLHEEINGDWQAIWDLSEVLGKKTLSQPPPVKRTLPQRTLRRTRARREFNEDWEAGGEEEADQKEEVAADEAVESDSEVTDFRRMFNPKQLVKEIYPIAPMEITWTGMFGSPSTSVSDYSHEFCFLIVAMKSGHIQFWKISPNDNKAVSLVHEWDTELGLLTTMTWQQTSSTSGFLLCGSQQGVIVFLPVELDTQGGQDAGVRVKSMHKVWDEEDLWEVQHIVLLKTALRRYVMVAAKMYSLVACEITQTEESIIIQNVGHSFGLHKLPITGMAVLDARNIPQFRVLVSSMQGILVEIKVSVGKDKISFQNEKILIDLDLENNKIQGLDVSANGLLCGLALGTTVYYDHLEKKEPLQFAMFITKPFEEIFNKLEKILKPQISFLPSASPSIAYYSDYLEVLHIFLATEVPLPQWLTDLTMAENLEARSPMELYFMRYLLQAYVSGISAYPPIENTKELESRLEAVESAILRNHVFKVFQRCQDKLDLVSAEQGHSLILMADWIKVRFNEDVEGLREALGDSGPEVCAVCGEPVSIQESPKSGTCPKGHQFARCCQTLRLCDRVSYKKCLSCSAVAVCDLWGFGNACTFCGMTMSS